MNPRNRPDYDKEGDKIPLSPSGSADGGGSSSSSSDEEDNKGYDPRRNHGNDEPEDKTTQKIAEPETKGERHNSSYGHDYKYTKKPYTLGITGLAKQLDKEDKFGGTYDDDLELSIRRFRTLTEMCSLPDEEKFQVNPIMLKGDALDFFDDYQLQNIQRCI